MKALRLEEKDLDIIVCVKHVPETAETEIKIDASGRAIERTGLVFDIKIRWVDNRFKCIYGVFGDWDLEGLACEG